jgi:AcrR family transcriptional regulator
MSRVSGRPAPKKEPKTRAEQKLETRERLRKAAWELFTTTGFDVTTTKEIADRAGVAAGTVFVHASDKSDLLFLVMHDRLASTVDAAMATLPEAELMDQVLHLFRALFRMYGEHPAVSAAFVRSLPGAKGPNAERVDALTFSFFHRLSQLVRAAAERGEVARDIDAMVAANNMFAAYFMALLGWLNGYVTADIALDPGLKGALALQLRGLLPSTPTKKAKAAKRG